MKKMLLMVLIISMCVLPLFAKGESEAAKPVEKTVLSVWYHQYGEVGVEEAVRRYGKIYEEAHPDVTIDINWMVGDWRKNLYAALAAKSKDPDVFEESAPTATMIESGQVAELTDLFDAKAKGDFLPSEIAVNTYEGKIYGARMFVDATGFYYQPSVFKAAGVSVPNSFEELIQTAKKLTTSDMKGAYIGNSMGVGTFGYIVVWASGIEGFISEDNTKILLDDPRVVTALEQLRKLAQSDALLLGYPVSEWQPDALVNGECAMQWGGMWFLPAMRDALGDDFATFPMPKIASSPTGRIAASAGGFSAMVNGFSDNLQAAKDYVKWMWIDDTGADIQLDFATAYGFHMPVKKSVLAVADRVMGDPRSLNMINYTSEYGVFKSGNGYGNSNLWDSVMHTAFGNLVSDVVKTNDPIAPMVKAAAQACQARLDELNK